mgnify:CR=1 FL=1
MAEAPAAAPKRKKQPPKKHKARPKAKKEAKTTVPPAALAALRTIVPEHVPDAALTALAKSGDAKHAKAKVRKWWRDAEAKDAKAPATKNGQWWRKLAASETDPISLEPLNRLRMEPFELDEEGHKMLFDARVLAAYLVSSNVFANPLTRRELTRETCALLDAHLAKHGRKQDATVARALDLSQDDDAQRRWSAAKDLLDRLEVRLKDPSRANRLWRTKRERKQAYTSAMVVAGRAGKADAALKLFDYFEEDELAPDTACFNAALAACRRSDVETYADFAKKLWRRCVESDDAQPDSLTAAEAVACLERAGRSNDADAIFAEALELGVPLKQARSAGPQGVAKRSVAWLDDDSEYDVSGLSVPLVKCAVRKALRDETASDHTADCVFITGVGAKKLKDPTHVPLRDSVLAFLRKFEPPLDAYVPKDAQGTVVVSRSSLLDRLDYDNEESIDRGGKRRE